MALPLEIQQTLTRLVGLLAGLEFVGVVDDA